MHKHRLTMVAALLALPMFATGCITAKSLRPIAQQNQTNTAEMVRNVAALHEIANAMVTANSLVFIDGRVRDIDIELEDVLGEAKDDLPPGATWTRRFSGNEHGDSFAKVTALIATQPDETIRESTARKYGWIYTAATDDKFTPDVAKDLQKKLAPVFDLDKDKRVLLVPEIFGQYDPQLAFRVETAEGVQAILGALKKELDHQLNAAQQYAARFAKASEADLELDRTIMGVLGSDEAKTLITGLAEEHIDDPDVRSAALGLFERLTTSK
jgi:hypothetical protein